jgi:hypothetical protein
MQPLKLTLVLGFLALLASPQASSAGEEIGEPGSELSQAYQQALLQTKDAPAPQSWRPGGRFFKTNYANHVGQVRLRDRDGRKHVLHFFGGNHDPGFPWGGRSFNDFVGYLCGEEPGSQCRKFERSVYPSSAGKEDDIVGLEADDRMQATLRLEIPGLSMSIPVRGGSLGAQAYGFRGPVRIELTQEAWREDPLWRQPGDEHGSVLIDGKPYAVERVFLSRELGFQSGLKGLDMFYDYIAGWTQGDCRQGQEAPVYLMKVSGGMLGVKLGLKGSLYYDSAQNALIEDDLGLSYKKAAQNILGMITFPMDHPFQRRLVYQELRPGCVFYGLEEKHVFFHQRQAQSDVLKP